MSRIHYSILSLLGGLYLSTTLVSAQIIGGPPLNKPSPIKIRQQTVTAQPNIPQGPSAEEILRLIFPPEPVSPIAPTTRQRTVIQPEIQRLQRSVPSDRFVAQMTMLEQRSLLRQALANLEEEFTKLPTGTGWKNYLHVEKFGHALWCQSFPDTDIASRDVLKEIMQRLNLVKQNTNYTKISNLWGFKVAQVVLPWYTQSAVDKHQLQLSLHLSSFDQSLNRLKTGSGWKRHLQSDEVMRLATQKEMLNKPEEMLLREIHQRYQQVQQDEKYRVISMRPGFSKTNTTLRQIVEAIQAERQKAAVKNALQSIAASKNGSPLERNVAVALQKLKDLRMACDLESKAQWQASLSSKTLKLADGDQREMFDRKSNEANEILRLAKDRHTQAIDSAEENLRKILMMIKNAKKEERAGETVMLLPLEDPQDVVLYELLPLDNNEPEPAEAEVLPLENEKEEPAETEVLPLED